MSPTKMPDPTRSFSEIYLTTLSAKQDFPIYSATLRAKRSDGVLFGVLLLLDPKEIENSKPIDIARYMCLQVSALLYELEGYRVCDCTESFRCSAHAHVLNPFGIDLTDG